MSKSFMGSDDAYKALYNKYPDGNGGDPNAYVKIKEMLQKEREKQLLEQAAKLAALEQAMQDSISDDSDDFEIGGAL
jgi:hypothetical protein